MSLEGRLVQNEPPADCPLCPRLVAYRQVAREKMPVAFNGAVPSFGDADARCLIVGLAPGLKGANRTGRPFTGDGAGDVLYYALAKYGFSEGHYDRHKEDGLRLKGVMITNAVRCVPPENAPKPAEIAQCRPFLAAQIEGMASLRVILCLGKISHDSSLRALGLKPAARPFGHGTEYALSGGRTLLSSYHCSRYNMQTGRLNLAMFDSIFARIKALIAARGE